MRRFHSLAAARRTDEAGGKSNSIASADGHCSSLLLLRQRERERERKRASLKDQRERRWACDWYANQLLQPPSARSTGFESFTTRRRIRCCCFRERERERERENVLDRSSANEPRRRNESQKKIKVFVLAQAEKNTSKIVVEWGVTKKSEERERETTKKKPKKRRTMLGSQVGDCLPRSRWRQ